MRLRLGEGWRALANCNDVASAHSALVGQGRLQANEAQEAAAQSLSQIPGALGAARAKRQQWDQAQASLTKVATEAAARTRNSRAESARWKPGKWITGEPKTPMVPEVVGPVCWLKAGPPPRLQPAGCYLHGSVGSGKSTLMDLFTLFGRAEFHVRRQHFHEFSLWLHQSLRDLGGSRPDKSHVLARVADSAAEGTDIICLDEFAVTNVADAAIYADLLKLLAERNVAVICTTNRPPEDLYKEGLHRERYLPALIDRIREDFLVRPVIGTDYRAEMLRAEAARCSAAASSPAGGDAIRTPPVFFHGGCADEAFRTVFTLDVGSASGPGTGSADGVPDLGPGEVKVAWGRKLQVPGMAGGIARFHFDDVCRRAISAEDFLYLASSFHTVYLHDVPRLSLEEHNEARRFTNLVDALYESSVRLVCHCLVPLDQVLTSVEKLRTANTDEHDADRLGVFESMYDDTPNFQIQIQELGGKNGGRQKWRELQERQQAEEMRASAKRWQRLSAPAAVEGDTGSGWSAAPASADLSAPDQGVAGVMVAAVGSLQESGFAASRAVSRLKEMQTSAYLEAARQRRDSMSWAVA